MLPFSPVFLPSLFTLLGPLRHQSRDVKDRRVYFRRLPARVKSVRTGSLKPGSTSPPISVLSSIACPPFMADDFDVGRVNFVFDNRPRFRAQVIGALRPVRTALQRPEDAIFEGCRR